MSELSRSMSHATQVLTAFEGLRQYGIDPDALFESLMKRSSSCEEFYMQFIGSIAGACLGFGQRHLFYLDTERKMELLRPNVQMTYEAMRKALSVFELEDMLVSPESSDFQLALERHPEYRFVEFRTINNWYPVHQKGYLNDSAGRHHMMRKSDSVLIYVSDRTYAWFHLEEA